jgi:diguanylate cyclase (GGDEF)-like protein
MDDDVLPSYASDRFVPVREAMAQYARIGVPDDELAKAWLLRVIERTSPSDLGDVPLAWIATEAPPLIGDILNELADASSPGQLSPQGRRAARELSRLRSGGSAPAQVPRDLASLHAVLIEALRREGADREPGAFGDAVERLAEIFGTIQADLVEALVDERGSRAAEAAAADAAPAAETRAAEAPVLARDEATGLPGAVELHDYLAILAAEYRRYSHPFALMLIDIDGLQRINEAYGREVGDRMLTAVANAVSGQVRSVDRAFRLTEDEFCIVSPHQVASTVQPLADRLTSSVNGWQHHDGPRMSVTVGVASCPEHGEDPERLLQVAEEATYAAKASGRRFSVAPGGNQSFMQEPERT